MFWYALFAYLASVTAFGQFRSSQWTADSGLPQNSVRGIVQTPDGYIWVATLNGVARFDGVQFRVFDKSNTPGMSSNRFSAMTEGLPGDLWLVGEDGNVIRYHENKFRTLGLEHGIRPGSVSGITSDKHGNVWVNSDGGFYRWTEPGDRFEKQRFGDKGVLARTLRWVGTGFWGLQGDTLLCFVHGQFETLPLPKWMLREKIKAVAVGADDVVWVATADGGLARGIKGNLAMISGTTVMQMQATDKAKWTVSIDHNVDRTVSFPSGGAEKGIRYNVIALDKEGNIWVGSEGQGLFRIQKQFISVYSRAQGLASSNIYPVLKSKNGDMWIGSWPAALSRIHNGEVTNYTRKDGLQGLPSSLAEDYLGNLWVGTQGQVRVFSKGRFVVPPNLPKEGMPSVQAIYGSVDGSMMLGTAKGIYILHGKDFQLLTARDGLATDDVRVIIGGRDGSVWMGGYGGLTQMQGSRFKRWTEKDGLPSNNVRSIYEDAAGNLWIGTYDGGLGLLRDGKWSTFNKDRGLFDNGAFQVLEDAHDNLWISSNRGIYRVNKKQLLAVSERRSKRIESIGYGRSDGMLSVECNGGLWPAGAKDNRGFLWFPTQDGVAVVNPNALTLSPQGPKAVIESVIVDHVATGSVDEVRMLPGQSSLEIQYTALSFTKPEQIHFQYKLDGVDEDWEYVGQRRTAYYKHLSPGEYVFHLVAMNSDGVASKTERTLLVRVIPPFYLKWWFVSVVCLVVLATVWFAWTYRIRQLKKLQAAQKAFSQQLIASQEGERRRIAAELHDSLGQRLIVINNLAHFLLKPKGKISSEEDRIQTLREITSEATAAMDETRAISYDLRPFQLDRLGLCKAIQGLARTVSIASGIKVTTELGEIDEVFPEELRINFFRIVQESVNNIVKHSGADQAEIKATVSDSAILLTIYDNGRGLPVEPRPLLAGPGGFGLSGIEERANLLNGTMSIRNGAVAGTILTVAFKLERKRTDA